MKTIQIIILAILFTTTYSIYAQVAITTDGSSADGSAMLDVKSTTKGMLTPRLTTAQRTAISEPATGLLVFDSDLESFYFYNGTAWINLSSGNASNVWSKSGSDVSLTNTDWNLGIGTASPASKFHLYGGEMTLQNNDADNTLKIKAGAYTDYDNYATLALQSGFGDYNYDEYSFIRAVNTGNAGYSISHLTFGKKVNNGGFTEHMRINTSGNVGLGTTAPLLLLDAKAGQIMGTSATTVSQHDVSNRGTKVSFGASVESDLDEFAGMRIEVEAGTNGGGNTADVVFNTWEYNTAYSREVMRINGAGNIVAQGQIKNLTDPIEAQDAATKAYAEAYAEAYVEDYVEDYVDEVETHVNELETYMNEVETHVNELETYVNGLEIRVASMEDILIEAGLFTVTDVDGNIYNTVKIGDQAWITENLKTTKYNDGTDIPLVTDNSAWGNLTTPGYCWYANDSATYGDTYGALYNWFAVNTGKLCPVGWHVPSDAEWTTLSDYLGGAGVAGGKLKETGFTHWLHPNTGATNETGFTGLPAGGRYGYGVFNALTFSTRFSCSTESQISFYCFYSLGYQTASLGRAFQLKQYGNSVRCMKD